MRPDTQEGSEDRTSSPSLPQGSPAIVGEELEHAAQQSRSYSSLCRFGFFLPCPTACGILIPLPGMESCPLHWELRVATTGPLGKSQLVQV